MNTAELLESREARFVALATAAATTLVAAFTVGEQPASAESHPTGAGTGVAAEIGGIALTDEPLAAELAEGLPGLSQSHCGDKTGADKVACEYTEQLTRQNRNPASRHYQVPPRRETSWKDNAWFQWARDRQQENRERIIKTNPHIKGLDQNGSPCIRSDSIRKCDDRYVSESPSGVGTTPNGNPCTISFKGVPCNFDKAPAAEKPRANSAPANPSIQIGGGGGGSTKRACGPLNAKLTGCTQNVG
jgi:hypothetical protein